MIGTGHSRCSGDLRNIDIRDKEQVKSLLDEIKPDYVVNCIAIRFPDIVENDPVTTSEINVAFPGYLAELCKERKIFLIHISTDYVFDGEHWPYHPQDKTNPLNKVSDSLFF